MDRKNHGDEINPKRNLAKDSSSEDDDNDVNYEDIKEEASSQGTTISDKDPLSGDDEGPNTYPLYQSKRPPVKIPPLYLTEAEVEDFFLNESLQISSSDEGSPGSNDAKRLDKKEKQKVEKKASMTLEERKAADKREVKFPQNLYKNRNKPPRGFAKGFEAKIIKPPNKSRPLKRNMEQSKYKAAWDKYDKEVKEENKRYDEWKKENSNRNAQERYDPGMEATRIMTRISKGRNPIPIDKPPSTSIERMDRNLIRAIAASPNAKKIETDRTRIAAARPNNDDKASDDRRKNNVRANVITLTVPKGYRLDVPPKVQCGPHSDLVRTEYRIKRKLSDETKKRIEDERTSSKKRDDRDSSSKEREINNKSFDSYLEDTLLSTHSSSSPHKDSPIQSTSKMAYQQQQQQKSDSDKKKIVKRTDKETEKVTNDIINEDTNNQARPTLSVEDFDALYKSIENEFKYNKGQPNSKNAPTRENVLSHITDAISSHFLPSETRTIKYTLLNDVRVTLDAGSRRLRTTLPEHLVRYVNYLHTKKNKTDKEKKHIARYNSYLYDFVLGIISVVLRRSCIRSSAASDEDDKDFYDSSDSVNPINIGEIIETFCDDYKEYLVQFFSNSASKFAHSRTKPEYAAMKTRSGRILVSNNAPPNKNRKPRRRVKLTQRQSLRQIPISNNELVTGGIQNTVFQRLVGLSMDDALRTTVPGISFNVRTAVRFLPGNWLSDDAVDVGMGLVANDMTNENIRTVAVDTGIVSLLASGDELHDGPLSERFLNAQRILLPLNVVLRSDSSHYVLMMVNMERGSWTIYDPLLKGGSVAFGIDGAINAYYRSQIIRNIRSDIEGLDRALCRITGMNFSTSTELQNGTLTLADNNRLIIQRDYASCGALIIHGARTLIDQTYMLRQDLAQFNLPTADPWTSQPHNDVRIDILERIMLDNERVEQSQVRENSFVVGNDFTNASDEGGLTTAEYEMSDDKKALDGKTGEDA